MPCYETLVKEKIAKICEMEDVNLDDLEELAFDLSDIIDTSAICMNVDCNEIYRYEPDAHKARCSECETNTVDSLYVLLGYM